MSWLIWTYGLRLGFSDWRAYWERPGGEALRRAPETVNKNGGAWDTTAKPRNLQRQTITCHLRNDKSHLSTSCWLYGT